MNRLIIVIACSLLFAAARAVADDAAASTAAHGIPPEIARKLAIPAETLRQIDDAVFEANRALIDLDASHKKAQLELERELRSPTPDAARAMALATTASETELAVRKNRLGLLLKIRQLLGPDLWDRVQAEISAQPRATPSSAPAPAAPQGNPSSPLVMNPATLPELHCGRQGDKPVELHVDKLAHNHLALSLKYPSGNQQGIRYLIEEVRSLENGHKALAGHKLSNADGKDAWLDPTGSFLLFSGTPSRSDELNSTYQFVDSRPEVQIDLTTGAEGGPSGRRAASVYLRCDNLDAFIEALSAR